MGQRRLNAVARLSGSEGGARGKSTQPYSRKRDGEWKMAHGHNTPINPKAQAFDPLSGT
jgi:hypothetical protein